MELREIIEIAEKTAGGRPQLAKALGIASNNLTDAKGNRRGLPVGVCVMLADMVGIEPMEVIAASELVTEKNEQRRASLLPYLRHAAAIAGISITASIFTNVMTATPAEASPLLAPTSEAFYIMLNAMLIWKAAKTLYRRAKSLANSSSPASPWLSGCWG